MTGDGGTGQVSGDAAHYNLVMPFVTCTDHGGPHQPDSYVAGWEMGALDLKLGTVRHLAPHADVPGETMLHRVNGPMVDLIAMKHGYTAVLVPVDEEWAMARFLTADEQGAL